MRRGLAAAVLFGVLAAACTPSAPVATPSPSASGPAKVQVTDKTAGELQAVLTAQRDALVKRDLGAYQTTFDSQRGAFRRCKQEAFDVAGRQGASSAAPRVVKAEAYGDTYARAWVDEGGNGVVRSYFRVQNGRWIQTEPTADEVGKEQTKTFDGIDIDYWTIDDDVIESLGRGTLKARELITANQLADTRQPFGIRFYPTRSVQGLQECSVVGFHIPNAAANDKYIRFFRYWFTTDLKDLSPTTLTFIQHEGLHWAQDQFSPGISARLDWWLVEGWPDYIGQSRSTDYKRTVICGFPAPTYKQLVDGPRTDLPEFPPEEAVRYYAFANTMIEYLYAKFGAAAYKELLVAYKDTASADRNLPLVLKVTPADYYAGWLAFAKQKYC